MPFFWANDRVLILHRLQRPNLFQEKLLLERNHRFVTDFLGLTAVRLHSRRVRPAVILKAFPEAKAYMYQQYEIYLFFL